MNESTLPESVLIALAAVPRWGDGHPHLLTGLEPGPGGTLALLHLAEVLRQEERALARLRPLAGRVFAGMFFDPSLRTRTSMAVACGKLGAEFLDLAPASDLWTLEFGDEVVMDGRAAEHVREAAGTLGCYADLLGLRAFPGRGRWEQERSQPVHTAFARHAGVPVINLEGPFAHPCQGLADAMTLRELLDDPRDSRFVLAWAPHPEQQPVAVAHSALWAAASLGMETVVMHPPGFELDPAALEEGHRLAAGAGGRVTVTHDRAALDGAHVVYAKAWGALDGAASRSSGHADAMASLRDWTVTAADLRRGPAWLMHPLPVRRGVEVSDAALDGDRSRVLLQARNRLWAQAALLLALLR